MGAAASVAQANETNGVSAEAKEFISYFLPYAEKPAKKLRSSAWAVIDNNGNGYVSLAETGKWIQDFVNLQMIEEAKESDRGKGKKKHLSKDQVQEIKDESKALYKRFYPCYIRAFLDAADIGKNGKVGGTKSATKDDYVQRSEFRYLCVYLCIYALMYDAFDLVDGGTAGATKDDDRRISITELEEAVGKFKGHPLVGVAMLGMPSAYKNVENIFKEMDADGKGKVLLVEWCQWLEQKEVENQTILGDLLIKGEEEKAEALQVQQS